jgi:transcriptional repressor NrdR
MQCPFCKGSETAVIDSRETENGDSVRRRRTCEVCKKRFILTSELRELLKYSKKKESKKILIEKKLKRLVKAPGKDQSVCYKLNY